jgi:hypothetical protein
MSEKTCGECKYYNDAMFHCEKFDCMTEDGWSCPGCEEKEKPKPTNGDVIRQGGNDALAHFKSEHRCDICAYAAPLDHAPACQRPDGKVCYDGMLAWLNAPAKEGEDE